jgi:D-alanyl-D-alanine carboxypeptidase
MHLRNSTINFSRVIRSVMVIASVLLIAASTPAVSDSVDTFIRTEMANQRLPGVALAVIRDGKPIKIKSYGLANVELNVPVTSNTVFRLASLSKQFIAVGVLLLENDGKLALNDSICKYLQDCPESWRPITLRHVLRHTSGLPREAPGYNPFEIVTVESGGDVIRRAYALPLLGKPDEKFSYSNLGYAILTEVIRVASGRPWPEFMADRVFKPLGMSATRITDMVDIVPNRAGIYLFRDNKLQNAQPLYALRPAGAFLSTLDDLVKWDFGITNDKVIPRPLRDQMWVPGVLSDGSSTQYGFGWWNQVVHGHRVIRHGGSEPGIRTEYR